MFMYLYVLLFLLSLHRPASERFSFSSIVQIEHLYSFYVFFVLFIISLLSK